MDQDVNQESEKQIEKNVEQLLPQQKKPGKIALQVFAVIVLLSLVGAGVYVWQNNRVAQEQKKEVQTVKGVQAEASDVTSKVRSRLDQTYEIIDLDQNNRPTKQQVAIRLTQDSPIYQAKGYNYYTDYDGGSTMNVIAYQAANSDAQLPTSADVSIRGEVAKVYTDYGLTRKGSRGQTSDGTGIDVYEGKGLVCTATMLQSSISGSDVACGVISKYPMAAAQYKPFADLMGDLESTTILANLKIIDSAVKGYQRASLGQGDINLGGGAAVLFYRKAGESWKLFKTAQEALPCSDYNTSDLRNAYKGEKCYDLATNSSDEIVK